MCKTSLRARVTREYRSDSRFSNGQVWTNNVEPDQIAEEQVDQGLTLFAILSCLLDSFICGKTTLFKFYDTVMILSFRTDMPGQTVQTQIRLLLEEEQSDLGLHCLPFRLYRLDSLLYGRAT